MECIRLNMYFMHCIIKRLLLTLFMIVGQKKDMSDVFFLFFFTETSSKKAERRSLDQFCSIESNFLPQRVKFGIDFPQSIFPQWELSEAVNHFLKYNGQTNTSTWKARKALYCLTPLWTFPLTLSSSSYSRKIISGNWILFNCPVNKPVLYACVNEYVYYLPLLFSKYTNH